MKNTWSRSRSRKCTQDHTYKCWPLGRHFSSTGSVSLVPMMPNDIPFMSYSTTVDSNCNRCEGPLVVFQWFKSTVQSVQQCLLAVYVYAGCGIRDAGACLVLCLWLVLVQVSRKTREYTLTLMCASVCVGCRSLPRLVRVSRHTLHMCFIMAELRGPSTGIHGVHGVHGVLWCCVV